MEVHRVELEEQTEDTRLRASPWQGGEDMTGAAAGAAAGGDAGQGEGQQGGEGAGTGPDFAALQSMLDSQGQQLGEMREFLQSNPWAEIQQAARTAASRTSAPELDLGFLDPAVAATMDPDQLSAKLGEQMQAAARSEAEKLVQAQVAPLQQQIAEQQRSQEVNALIGEFPELNGGGDGAAGAGRGGATRGAARSGARDVSGASRAGAADRGGAGVVAGVLAVDVHGRSCRRCGAGGGRGRSSPATLESGAGATPGGGQGDLGDQIIGARRGASVLPY
jgi:hypothetical protein